jgi:hypothetical protein
VTLVAGVLAAAAYLSGTAVPAEPTRESPAAPVVAVGVVAGPPADCAEPSLDAPADAVARCDAALGWRMFAWVGESGDGIVQLQQLDQGVWVDRYFGPFCPNGVAAATPTELAAVGVPTSLADEWGFPPSACRVDD